MPPKLDYCFITSTSLVPVVGLRNEREAASNTQSTFLEYAEIINPMFRLHKCACANIKVGMATNLQTRREKFSFECAANERRFEHSNIFPSPNRNSVSKKPND